MRTTPEDILREFKSNKKVDFGARKVFDVISFISLKPVYFNSPEKAAWFALAQTLCVAKRVHTRHRAQVGDQPSRAVTLIAELGDLTRFA
jgi:hypothetical protein